MRMGMNLGADDFLTKPFCEEELLDAISSRLKKSEVLKNQIVKNMGDVSRFFEEASRFVDLESLSKGYTLKTYLKKEMIYLGRP